MTAYDAFENAGGGDEGKEEKKIPLRFLHLPGDMECLKALGMPKTIPKGKVFIEPGDPVDHCYVVQKGCVTGYDLSPAGNERIYAVALDNALLLEVCAILGRPSPVYLKAIKDTELVTIPRKVLIGEIRRNSKIAMTVIESLCRKYSSVTEQIREIKCREAPWRLCNLFLIFAHTYGEPQGDKTVIKEKINQQLLADLLGINRVTTVRIVTALKSRGLIEKAGGFYCIPSLQKLSAYMESLEDKEL